MCGIIDAVAADTYMTQAFLMGEFAAAIVCHCLCHHVCYVL